MAALVRLGACVQAHVPLQMRGEFRFESAAGIGTSTQLRFHGGRGILVSSAMPATKRLHFPRRITLTASSELI